MTKTRAMVLLQTSKSQLGSCLNAAKLMRQNPDNYSPEIIRRNNEAISMHQLVIRDLQLRYKLTPPKSKQTNLFGG